MNVLSLCRSGTAAYNILVLVLFITFLCSSTTQASGKSWQSLPNNLANCLNQQRITPITQSDKKYDQLRFSYNHRIDAHPAAIVLPTSTDSVAKSVQCARAAGIKFSVRSGKHSYEGYGVQDGALLIDMSKMKAVKKIDSKANEVWLDSGLMLAEVYYYLSQWGKTVPGGSCGSVGMGGHVLGGGFGVRSRAYGLMIDHVAAIELVDVDGNILTADSSTHSDLFWALLGAGQGEFGVVTRFRMQTVDAKPVIEFEYEYPVKSAAKALRYLQALAANPSMPNELWMQVSLVRSRDSVAFYGQFIGSRNDFNKVISNVGLISTMGKPKSTTVSDLSYIQSVMSLANVPITDPPSSLLTFNYMPGSENWKAHSGFVKQAIADSDLDAFVAAFYNKSAPTFNIWDAYVLIDTWGGVVKDPSKVQRSVFAHRDAILSVQSWVAWSTGDAIQQPMLNWQNQVWKVLGPKLTGAFVNYADSDLSDYMGAYYPGQVAMLVEIKSKYDPDNVMNYAQSIPIESLAADRKDSNTVLSTDSQQNKATIASLKCSSFGLTVFLALIAYLF